MKIFVGNASIQLTDQSKKLNTGQDAFVRGSASSQQVLQYYRNICSGHVRGAADFVFVVSDVRKTFSEISSHFTQVIAAGGIVLKGDEVLFILRNGVWDLPKGKAEAGEDAATTAIREVAEECGIEAAIRKEAGETWHTYQQHGQDMLKCSHWFFMDCLQDVHLKPQVEEGITAVRWVPKAEIPALIIPNTYRSIASLLNECGLA